MFKNFNGILFIKGEEISKIQLFVDPLIATLSIYFLVLSNSNLATNIEIIKLVLVTLVSSFLTFNCSDVYKKSFRINSLRVLLRKVFTNWFVFISIIIIYIFLTKTSIEYSRFLLSVWSLFFLFFLIFEHVFLRKILRIIRSKGKNSRKVIFWGDPESTELLIDNLKRNSWLGIYLHKWFYYETPNLESQNGISEIYGGSLKSFKEYLKDNEDIYRVIFTTYYENKDSFREIINILGDTTIQVTFFPRWPSNNMNLNINHIGDLICFDIWDKERNLLSLSIKEIFDFIFALTTILVLCPIYLIIWIILKFDSNEPAFFLQERYGINGKKFKIIKFRTMKNEKSENLIIKQATVDDPRVTNVGKFLRKWSLDEIPQFINVLKGEMSIVGPRPHASSHNEYYRKLIPFYMQRHAFKPGITGLSQVSSLRGETRTLIEMKNRIEKDLIYQKEWNLILDFKILLMTIFHIKTDKSY